MREKEATRMQLHKAMHLSGTHQGAVEVRDANSIGEDSSLPASRGRKISGENEPRMPSIKTKVWSHLQPKTGWKSPPNFSSVATLRTPEPPLITVEHGVCRKKPSLLSPTHRSSNSFKTWNPPGWPPQLARRMSRLSPSTQGRQNRKQT